MNRSEIYAQEQARSFDVLWGWKDALIANSYLWQALLGEVIDTWSGFTPTQTIPASLTINFTSGQVNQLAATDATPYGTLDADPTLITQQGILGASSLTLVNGLSAGTQWALIQCNFAQVDAVRTGDPNNGVQPFYNPENPANPYQGQGNNGGVLPSVRQGLAQLSVVYGTVDAGPPQPSGGCLPMFLIQLSAAQTQITTNEILLAQDSTSTPGYQHAPLLAGLLNSHHGGVPGEAPKINAATELTGQVAFGQLPATDSVNGKGLLPVLFMNGFPGFTFTGNPNGNLPGQIGDLYIDTVTGICWRCTVSGSAGIAVWVQLNPLLQITQNLVVMTSSGTYTPSANLLFAAMEIFGGGGGSGHGSAPAAGGGGGGGGFGTVYPTAAQIGASCTVVIGAGGGAEAAGGSTVVSNSNFTATALGGSGGVGASEPESGGAGGSFSLAGTGVQYVPGTGSGGGGGGGYSGSGFICGGNGGSTSRGGGGAGSAANVGTNGNLFGGGAGAGNSLSSSGASGGNGGVVILEFIVSE